MHTYHIKPKGPLLFRDGKPFGAAERADTLPFPLPSTIAGALRTCWGDSQHMDFSKEAEALAKVPVQGPLLTQQGQDGKTTILFPAPADALCLNEDGETTIHRLRPGTLKDSRQEGMDFPADSTLLPVFLSANSKGKPFADAPRFWEKQTIIHWLSDDSNDTVEAADIGAGALPIEVRTHVALDNRTLTHRDGMLYQTSGLDFSERRTNSKRPSGWNNHHYGLLVRCAKKFPDTYRTIGGEARLGHIHYHEKMWPKIPAELGEKLANAKGIRLMLVTPAIFNNGWKPAWLNQRLEGALPHCPNIKVRLAAASMPRWQAVSGWSMARINGKKPGARPVKRLAAAGSVYWFHIIETSTEDKAAELKKLWLASVSDQQAHDGFGLVLPGLWSNPSK